MHLRLYSFKISPEILDTISEDIADAICEGILASVDEAALPGHRWGPGQQIIGASVREVNTAIREQQVEILREAFER